MREVHRYLKRCYAFKNLRVFILLCSVIKYFYTFLFKTHFCIQYIKCLKRKISLITVTMWLSFLGSLLFFYVHPAKVQWMYFLIFKCIDVCIYGNLNFTRCKSAVISLFEVKFLIGQMKGFNYFWGGYPKPFKRNNLRIFYFFF